MMNETIKYRLRRQYDQIDPLIEGYPESFLEKRQIPDKWSIRENLAHLGRYQENFINRVKKILEEARPAFGRYKAEEDPGFEDWLALDARAIIVKTKASRKIIAENLISLNEQQLQRTGIHPKLGEMAISDWTEFFLLHESHHFYTIFWLVHDNN